MRAHRRMLFAVLVVLGAAVVVLPAVAGSETGPPAVTATNSEGIYKEQRHYWSPAAVTVGPGGAVIFSNPSGEVPHGLEWTGGPGIPSCSGLPAGGLGATNWRGECTFAQAGTYTFRCTVHPSEMSGTVTVGPNGTTTTTSTPTPTAIGPSAPPPGTSQQPSPLAGPSLQSLKLAQSQRGAFVRGSVTVASAGTGARLEVDLLARRASVAASGAAKVRVGRLVRTGLGPGTVAFKVGLTQTGRRALHSHRRLAVDVRVLLTPAHGTRVTVTRRIMLHA